MWNIDTKDVWIGDNLLYMLITVTNLEKSSLLHTSNFSDASVEFSSKPIGSFRKHNSVKHGHTDSMVTTAASNPKGLEFKPHSAFLWGCLGSPEVCDMEAGLSWWGATVACHLVSSFSDSPLLSKSNERQNSPQLWINSCLVCGLDKMNYSVGVYQNGGTCHPVQQCDSWMYFNILWTTMELRWIEKWEMSGFG